MNPDQPLDSTRNPINQPLAQGFAGGYVVPEPSSFENAKGEFVVPPVQPHHVEAALAQDMYAVGGQQNMNYNGPPPPYTGQQYYPPPPPTGYANPYPNTHYIAPAIVPIHTTTIVIDAIPNTVNCPICLRATNNRINRVAGGTAFCWFIVLLICFWPLCWLPFVMSSCQDVELVCVNCGTVKVRVPAN